MHKKPIHHISRFIICLITGTLLLLLTSCTSTVRLNVMKPADVTVKPHIQKIALLNRSTPISKKASIIEGVITGEWMHQDAEASLEVLNGLQSVLHESSRFEVVNTGIKLKGSKTGETFTNLLAWLYVEQTCKKYNADAVIELGLFDTDFIITKGHMMVNRKDTTGREFQEKVFTAEGVASVKAGLRFYDPANKVLIEEKVYERTNTWKYQGATVHEALAKMVNRTEAIKRVCHYMGEMYGYRISPAAVTVKRMMYKKAKRSPDLQIGYRRAAVNDWQGAADAWKKSVKTPHMKTAGKAAYNLALAYEVLDNLQEAKKWAQKAYTDYGNDDAKRYVYTLEGRIEEAQRLKEQMGE